MWCIWFVNNDAYYFTNIVAHDFRYDTRTYQVLETDNLDEIH